jgi:hypothetical protein
MITVASLRSSKEGDDKVRNMTNIGSSIVNIPQCQSIRNSRTFTSMYFFALSHAPPVLEAEMAICKGENE